VKKLGILMSIAAILAFSLWLAAPAMSVVTGVDPPSPVDFGSPDVGDYTEVTINVTMTGQPYGEESISIQNDTGAFEIISVTMDGMEMAPGIYFGVTSITVTVSFAPSAVGSYGATLQLVGLCDIILNGEGVDGSAPPENEAPTAVVSASPQEVILGETVTFDGSASDDDGEIVSYVWDFGDGIGDGITTSHTYAAAGDYNVTLTVTDDDGATGSDTATVTVLSSADAIESLIDMIEELGLPEDLASGLAGRLAGVISALEKDKDNVAINKLEAFINYVEARTGKNIDEGDADALIEMAERIIASIGFDGSAVESSSSKGKKAKKAPSRNMFSSTTWGKIKSK